jgi:hypothetical protein
VLDWVSGIGTYLFGHSDNDLLETAVVAAAGDAVYQGHLMPGVEYHGLLKALLRHTRSTSRCPARHWAPGCAW